MELPLDIAWNEDMVLESWHLAIRAQRLFCVACDNGPPELVNVAEAWYRRCLALYARLCQVSKTTDIMKLEEDEPGTFSKAPSMLLAACIAAVWDSMILVYSAFVCMPINKQNKQTAYYLKTFVVLFESDFQELADDVFTKRRLPITTGYDKETRLLNLSPATWMFLYGSVVGDRVINRLSRSQAT